MRSAFLLLILIHSIYSIRGRLNDGDYCNGPDKNFKCDCEGKNQVGQRVTNACFKGSYCAMNGKGASSNLQCFPSIEAGKICKESLGCKCEPEPSNFYTDYELCGRGDYCLKMEGEYYCVVSISEGEECRYPRCSCSDGKIGAEGKGRYGDICTKSQLCHVEGLNRYVCVDKPVPIIFGEECDKQVCYCGIEEADFQRSNTAKCSKPQICYMTMDKRPDCKNTPIKMMSPGTQCKIEDGDTCLCSPGKNAPPKMMQVIPSGWWCFAHQKELKAIEMIINPGQQCVSNYGCFCVDVQKKKQNIFIKPKNYCILNEGELFDVFSLILNNQICKKNKCGCLKKQGSDTAELLCDSGQSCLDEGGKYICKVLVPIADTYCQEPTCLCQENGGKTADLCQNKDYCIVKPKARCVKTIIRPPLTRCKDENGCLCTNEEGAANPQKLFANKNDYCAKKEDGTLVVVKVHITSGDSCKEEDGCICEFTDKAKKVYGEIYVKNYRFCMAYEGILKPAMLILKHKNGCGKGGECACMDNQEKQIARNWCGPNLYCLNLNEKFVCENLKRIENEFCKEPNCLCKEKDGKKSDLCTQDQYCHISPDPRCLPAIEPVSKCRSESGCWGVPGKNDGDLKGLVIPREWYVCIKEIGVSLADVDTRITPRQECESEDNCVCQHPSVTTEPGPGVYIPQWSWCLQKGENLVPALYPIDPNNPCSIGEGCSCMKQNAGIIFEIECKKGDLCVFQDEKSQCIELENSQGGVCGPKGCNCIKNDKSIICQGNEYCYTKDDKHLCLPVIYEDKLCQGKLGCVCIDKRAKSPTPDLYIPDDNYCMRDLPQKDLIPIPVKIIPAQKCEENIGCACITKLENKATEKPKLIAPEHICVSHKKLLEPVNSLIPNLEVCTEGPKCGCLKNVLNGFADAICAPDELCAGDSKELKCSPIPIVNMEFCDYFFCHCKEKGDLKNLCKKDNFCFVNDKSKCYETVIEPKQTCTSPDGCVCVHPSKVKKPEMAILVAQNSLCMHSDDKKSLISIESIIKPGESCQTTEICLCRSDDKADQPQSGILVLKGKFCVSFKLNLYQVEDLIPDQKECAVEGRCGCQEKAPGPVAVELCSGHQYCLKIGEVLSCHNIPTISHQICTSAFCFCKSETQTAIKCDSSLFCFTDIGPKCIQPIIKIGEICSSAECVCSKDKVNFDTPRAILCNQNDDCATGDDGKLHCLKGSVTPIDTLPVGPFTCHSESETVLKSKSNTICTQTGLWCIEHERKVDCIPDEVNHLQTCQAQVCVCQKAGNTVKEQRVLCMKDEACMDTLNGPICVQIDNDSNEPCQKEQCPCIKKEKLLKESADLKLLFCKRGETCLNTPEGDFCKVVVIQKDPPTDQMPVPPEDLEYYEDKKGHFCVMRNFKGVLEYIRCPMFMSCYMVPRGIICIDHSRRNIIGPDDVCTNKRVGCNCYLDSKTHSGEYDPCFAGQTCLNDDGVPKCRNRAYNSYECVNGLWCKCGILSSGLVHYDQYCGYKNKSYRWESKADNFVGASFLQDLIEKEYLRQESTGLWAVEPEDENPTMKQPNITPPDRRLIVKHKRGVEIF